MRVFRLAFASVFSALVIGGLSIGEAPGSVGRVGSAAHGVNRVPLPGAVRRTDHLTADNKHGRKTDRRGSLRPENISPGILSGP